MRWLYRVVSSDIVCDAVRVPYCVAKTFWSRISCPEIFWPPRNRVPAFLGCSNKADMIVDAYVVVQTRVDIALVVFVLHFDIFESFDHP